MIAPRKLPGEYRAWNDKWGSPFGHSERLVWLKRFPGLEARFRGPFAYQPNNTTRRFEFPWAYFEATRRGRSLDVVEVGGGLSGLQFVLASEGHRVVNVDPGLEAAGKGWDLNRRQHQHLCEVFHAPVELRPTTLGEAGIADASADVLVCLSALEHFAEKDLREFAEHASRVLKPDGVAVITVDLFLDLDPFTGRAANVYGRNIDIMELLRSSGLRLCDGRPSELCGSHEFRGEEVLANLPNYMVGEFFPALAQCFVCRREAAGSQEGGAR
jgi:SAM-dependent methyltransferase